MQANFARTDGVVVVELKGHLDFETSAPFRRTCLERLVAVPVVFDLKDLNFVGSLGLTEFVDTLETLAGQTGAGVRFCGVGVEFRRLFEANVNLARAFIFDSPEQAIRTFPKASTP